MNNAESQNGSLAEFSPEPTAHVRATFSALATVLWLRLTCFLSFRWRQVLTQVQGSGRCLGFTSPSLASDSSSPHRTSPPASATTSPAGAEAVGGAGKESGLCCLQNPLSTCPRPGGRANTAEGKILGSSGASLEHIPESADGLGRCQSISRLDPSCQGVLSWAVLVCVRLPGWETFQGWSPLLITVCKMDSACRIH